MSKPTQLNTAVALGVDRRACQRDCIRLYPGFGEGLGIQPLKDHMKGEAPSRTEGAQYEP